MAPSIGGGQPQGIGGSPPIDMGTPGADAGTNPISTPGSVTTDRGGNTGGFNQGGLGNYYAQALHGLTDLEIKTAVTAATQQSALEEITTNVGTYTETLVLPEVISPTMHIGPRIDFPLFGDPDFEDSKFFCMLGVNYITRTRSGGTQTNSMSTSNSNGDRGGASYTYNSLMKRYHARDHGLCLSYFHYYEHKSWKHDWLFGLGVTAEFFDFDNWKTDTCSLEFNWWFCWVAREVYGAHNPAWLDFRQWMLTSAPKWFFKLYLRFGERFANFISNKPRLKWCVRQWMDTKIGRI